jgi:hypothetical protein
VGKQKTYGRFLGTIFLKPAQMAYPPQMESLRKIKPLKNKKNAKKSVFWFFAVFGGTKPGTVCLTLLTSIIVPEGQRENSPAIYRREITNRKAASRRDA